MQKHQEADTKKRFEASAKAVAGQKHNFVVFDNLLHDEFANEFAKFALQQIISAFV